MDKAVANFCVCSFCLSMKLTIQMPNTWFLCFYKFYIEKFLVSKKSDGSPAFQTFFFEIGFEFHCSVVSFHRCSHKKSSLKLLESNFLTVELIVALTLNWFSDILKQKALMIWCKSSLSILPVPSLSNAPKAYENGNISGIEIEMRAKYACS